MKLFDFHHHKNHSSGIYNLGLFENIPQNKFSVGIHPKDVSEHFDERFLWLKRVSEDENCIAIGECGLDGLIEVDEELQEECFEKQILWANEIKKPVIIHCVRRFSQLLRFKKFAEVPMIVHGFNKKRNIADDLQNAGFYLSFGKAVLQNVYLQQILADFPISRMFLETDDADFEIEELYQKTSELKSISMENLENQIQENLRKITNL